MAAEAFVNHVPTMMGGVGARDVAEFYESYFIGHWPEDTEIITVDRTIGADKVVNEMILSFTHVIQMDAFLPGVPPTGRAGATSRGRGDGVRQRQSGVRAGLLGSGLGAGTGRPVGWVKTAGHGRRAGRNVLDKDLPANELLKRGG